MATGKDAAAATAIDTKAVEIEEMEIDGLRKAAIAVLLLGDELAEQLFRLFKPHDVRRLLDTSQSLRGVTEAEVVTVLRELVRELEHGVAGVTGHAHRIEEAAVSVFGADLIRAVASKELAGSAMQIHAVAVEKPEAFSKTLEKEHPQAIAVVLAMLTPEVSANVLHYLPEHIKVDVVRRIATLRSVSAPVLAGVTESVGREFGAADDKGPIAIDGTMMAVKLLKKVGSADEQLILDHLMEYDEEMGEDIKSRLFTFEDIVQLHDREVQLVMREVDQRQLPLAMKTASDEVRDKLLGNVSSRAAAMLRDDMDALGPVTLAQVEEAQTAIIRQIMEMAADGKVNLRPGDTV